MVRLLKIKAYTCCNGQKFSARLLAPRNQKPGAPALPFELAMDYADVDVALHGTDVVVVSKLQAHC